MKNLTLLIVLWIFAYNVNAAHEFQNFKLINNPAKNLKYQRDADGLSPMMSKVKDFMNKYGTQALEAIVEDLIDYNDDFTLGKFNTPSVNWESGIAGELGIKISRQVDPMFGSDKWRVFDSLTVTVGAKAFLENLRDAGEILITDEKLRLFGGVVFSRTYTYDHFADSYKAGLTKKFDRLLLGFYNFMWVNFLDITPGEVISKSDKMSISAGLSASTPSYYFISGYGEGTVYFSRLNTVSYHKPSEEFRHNESDALRVSRNVTKMVGSKLQVGIQADFYQILRITLLGMEFDMNYSKDQVTNMTFSESDMIKIRVNKFLKQAMLDLNKGSNPEKEPVLSDYITSREEGHRFSEELNLFGLVWGKHIGSTTEKLIFDTNEGKSYFYRHSDEKASIKKSFWNFLFSSRRTDRFSRRVVQNMTLEYQAPEGLVDFKDIEIEDPSNISFRVSKEYQAKKNKKRYRSEAASIINEFESIDGGIVHGLEDGVLKAPLVINLHAQVGAGGISNLLSKDAQQLRDSFKIICTNNFDSQVKLRRKHRRCIKTLAKLLLDSIKDYDTGTKLHLNGFKTFLKYATKKSKSFKSLKSLFGDEYVHLYGNFTALTRENQTFRSIFSEGNFQGHGLIKDYVMAIR